MIVIGSHNGLAGVARAYELLREGRSSLDAVVAGVTIIEDDPDELTVGFGGLPNEDGVVELDAAVMDGKTHRGAGVAALQNVRHPTEVARALLEQTKRVLVVGEGALAFARACGFPEENLLTEKARRMWLHWKRSRSNWNDWRTPPEDEVDPEILRWFEEHYHGQSAHGKTGTVHISALAHGDIACATSTSGHAFKMPGRVGDSPIIGAGLFCDNEAGSCGSLGYGEMNLENCTSFACVDMMRNGTSPEEAGLKLMKRIAERSPPWLLSERGEPNYNLWLYLLARDGGFAGLTMRGPKQFAVADQDGVRLMPCTALFENAE